MDKKNFAAFLGMKQPVRAKNSDHIFGYAACQRCTDGPAEATAPAKTDRAPVVDRLGNMRVRLVVVGVKGCGSAGISVQTGSINSLNGAEAGAWG